MYTLVHTLRDAAPAAVVVVAVVVAAVALAQVFWGASST